MKEILVHADLDLGRIGLSTKINWGERNKEKKFAMGALIVVITIGFIILGVLIWLRIEKKKRRERLKE